MDHEPIRDEQIIEAMEACRPGSADIDDPLLAPLARAIAADPELEERYERLQQADARMAAAFHDVPLPEGLSGRLLERLRADAGQASPLDQGAAPVEPDSLTYASRPVYFRRGLLVAVAAAATAAAVLVAVLVGYKAPQPYTEGEVLAEATQFFGEESADAGHLLAETPAPEEYPLSRDVLRSPQARWRPIQNFLGTSGVAYDLSGPGEVRATLYVVRQTISGLPGEPPLKPSLSTAGCSTAAWQAGGLVYVLVVEGGRRDYRNYLNLARGELAFCSARFSGWQRYAARQPPEGGTTKGPVQPAGVGVL